MIRRVDRPFTVFSCQILGMPEALFAAGFVVLHGSPPTLAADVARLQI